MVNKANNNTDLLTYIILTLIIVEVIFTKCFSFLLDDYKDYGTNCEAMGAEIEDYILRKLVTYFL